ncbi:MAG TPA: hypothetical protein VGW38_16280 [Chloroflexota bacterium]|nr:hypothetical protein [Chloroflexota bacterium]
MNDGVALEHGQGLPVTEHPIPEVEVVPPQPEQVTSGTNGTTLPAGL